MRIEDLLGVLLLCISFMLGMESSALHSARRKSWIAVFVAGTILAATGIHLLRN